MGKMRHINHRRPSKEAGRPKVLRGGVPVDAHPEPVSPEEKARREAELLLQSKLDEAEKLLRVKDTEIKGLKQQLINARDALDSVQKKQETEVVDPESGDVPKQIIVVTVDNITKDDTTATMTVLLEADGAVGEATLQIPVDQLKQIIRRKRKAQSSDG